MTFTIDGKEKEGERGTLLGTVRFFRKRAWRKEEGEITT